MDLASQNYLLDLLLIAAPRGNVWGNVVVPMICNYTLRARGHSHEKFRMKHLRCKNNYFMLGRGKEPPSSPPPAQTPQARGTHHVHRAVPVGHRWHGPHPFWHLIGHLQGGSWSTFYLCDSPPDKSWWKHVQGKSGRKHHFQRQFI